MPPYMVRRNNLYERLCIWCVCITFVQLAIVCDCHVNVEMRMLLAKFSLRLHNIDVTPAESVQSQIYALLIVVVVVVALIVVAVVLIQVSNASSKRDRRFHKLAAFNGNLQRFYQLLNSFYPAFLHYYI